MLRSTQFWQRSAAAAGVSCSAVKAESCANWGKKQRAESFCVTAVKHGTLKKSKIAILDKTFTGAADQTYVDFGSRQVVVGCGRGTSGEVATSVARGVQAALAKQASHIEIQKPSFSVSRGTEPSAFDIIRTTTEDGGEAPLSQASVARQLATAAVAATYKYTRMKSSKASDADGGANNSCTEAPRLAFNFGKQYETHVQDGIAIGNGINDARTLGNLRPDEGTPAFYAEWIRRHVASLPNVAIRHVLRGKQLEERGLRLMHAVGRCAVHEPVLVVTEYRGDKRSEESIALVGKGLTFDCGGMNVKPYGSMETMHQDMMGAAAVMGAMRAAVVRQLPVNLVAVTAFAENAIGPNAYLPSTIVRSLSGKTVEVLNTDAEGRLVLADALTFVQTKANLATFPSTIIDLATLTGAIVVALGDERAGLFSNNRTLAHALLSCGAACNEKLWPMPVGAEHTKLMKGGIADLINCAEGRKAGSSTAAAFLQEFIEKDRMWAHLDIAGTGMGGDKAKGVQPAGAPGFGVNLLVNYLLHCGGR